MKYTKHQLQEKCRELKLELPPALIRPHTIKDYIGFLQTHYLETRPETDPVRLILALGEPMLCYPYKDIAEPSYINLKTWIAEPKINGVRMLIVHRAGSLFFFSRGISSEDFLPLEYAIHIPQLEAFQTLPDFTLDSEIQTAAISVDTSPYSNSGAQTKDKSRLASTCAVLALEPEASLACQREGGQMLFKVFDILSYANVSQTTLNLKARKLKLQILFDQDELGWKSAHQFLRIRPLHPLAESTPDFLFAQAIEDGFEGVVYKNLNLPYEAGARFRHSWVKRKALLSRTSDIDGFITGFKPGLPDRSNAHLVGSLEISAYIDSKVTIIAYVSNLTDDDRLWVSAIGEDNQPALKPKIYGQAVTIDGQGFTSRNYHLQHPRLIRWRPDKRPEDCQLTWDYVYQNVS